MEKVEILGKWYKPKKLAKTVPISEDELKKMTLATVKKLLGKIGEAQGFGALKSQEFKQSRIQGTKAQVVYSAKFAKLKDAQIVLLGSTDNKKFDVLQFQFAKGK